MKYKEIIDEFSSDAVIPKKEAKRLLRILSIILQRNILAGNQVPIRNLGKLQRGVVAPRGTLNGKKTKAGNVVYFKMARSLRDKMRLL